MQTSSRFSPQKKHTVVLQPRVNRVPQTLLNGSKQGYSSDSKNSTVQLHSRGQQKKVSNSSRNTQKQDIFSYTQYPNTSNATDLLVRFGIDSTFGRVVTRILIALLLSQPVYVAMGMEIDEVQTNAISSSSQTSDTTNSQKNTPATEPVADVEKSIPAVTTEDTNADAEESSSDEIINTNNTVEEVDESATDSKDSTISVEEITGEEVEDTGSGITGTETAEQDTEGGDEDTTLSEEVEGTGTGTTDTDTTEQDTEGGDGGSLHDDSSTLIEDEVVDDTENDSQVDVASATQDSSNKYVFGEGDCTLVSDGEFYCVTDGPSTQVSADPRVYSEKDREGDREIYFFDGIEVKRITNNNYDDFAPVFDEETLRIVWQAMINDRLQIMMYEIPTNTTRQITSSRQNSSNPSILGDTVVWQEWIDTNWEIMMTDVNNDGQEFEIERITDNAVHDMFPSLYDGLITWQSERGSSWEVVVYDLRTKKTQTLEKDEDTKYENPRFVLLFDSKHENGDIETIGYNLDTGEKMELGTRANPQPKAPASPKDKAPDALPREENNVAVTKIIQNDTGDGDGGDGSLGALDVVDGGVSSVEEIIDDGGTSSVDDGGTTPIEEIFDEVVVIEPIE